MPWAIYAAELRLWLQLMVETELKKEELRQYPLLPNLDLNLRIGDLPKNWIIYKRVTAILVK